MSDLHLLLIEDHPSLVETLKDFFEDVGVRVDAAATGGEGLKLAVSAAHDVIVLDLGLPDLDGTEVCRRLRVQHRIQTPVLMLTARDTLADKLRGFEAGAHDYLCKPFAPEELEARVRALSRHHPRLRPEALQCGGVRLDPATHEVTREGRVVELTPTGFQLLRVLMQATPEFRGREELEAEIWGDFPPGPDAIRTHIAQLRKQLDKPFNAPPLIETRYGIGVRFREQPDVE
ncbi:MAG: response regulator transcription factor [Kiritimatiellia bacterium]